MPSRSFYVDLSPALRTKGRAVPACGAPLEVLGVLFVFDRISRGIPAQQLDVTRIPPKDEHSCPDLGLKVVSPSLPRLRLIQVMRWNVECFYDDFCHPLCALPSPLQVYMKQFGDDFERGGVEWGGFFLDED